MLLGFAILMLFMNFAGSSEADSTVDIYGHTGGAIVGFIWGLGFFPRVKNETSAKMRLAGMSMSVAFFLLVPILFFFGREMPLDPWHTDASKLK